MNISVDVDGVLAGFTTGFIAVSERLFPGKFPPGFDPMVDQTEWHFNGLLTDEETSKVWNAIASDKLCFNFWLNLPMIAKDMFAMTSFVKEAEELEKKQKIEPIVTYFITSRVPSYGWSVHEQTMRWLIKHGVGTLVSSVIVKPSGVSKQEIYRALGVKFSVDDYWENVPRPGEIKNHHGFLLERAWNQGHRNGYDTVSSLGEYLETVLDTAKTRKLIRSN